MAEYLVLIYENEASYATAGQEGMASVMKAHEEFGTNCAASLRGGNALQPAHTGTSIRRDESGEFVTTDGPFAETKDLIAGWMVIDVDTYERAVELAGELSAAPGAGGEPIHEWLEVRPFLSAPPTVAS